MTDPTRDVTVLDRRRLTQLMVMVSVGAAFSPFGAAKAEGGAHPSRGGGDELRAFMKLQSRSDDGYTNYLNGGTVLAALPGRQSVPLYGYEGLLRFHTRVAGADLYDVTFIEAGVYLDLKTGERLDHFQNPITGRANAVDHIVEGPFSWRWTVESLHVADPARGLHRRVAWQQFQGQSWLHFDNMISTSLPDGCVLGAAALATYVGSTAQIEDGGRASVSDTLLIDSSINPWAPWLAMEDAPGRLANNIVGRKLGALSEAPDRLTRFIASMHPAVLDGVDSWKAAR